MKPIMSIIPLVIAGLVVSGQTHAQVVGSSTLGVSMTEIKNVT